MADELSPEEAAAVATGGEIEENAERFEDHTTAEGIPDTPVETRTLRDRLLSTDPSTPLDEVESPWNPEAGGPARIMRGIQKMGDIKGIPAVADIAIGVLETMHQTDGTVVPSRDGDQDDRADDQDADAAGQDANLPVTG